MGNLAKGFPKEATYKVETMTGSSVDSTADFTTVWAAIDNMYDVLPAAGKTKNLHIHPDNGPCDRAVFALNESGTVTLNNISAYFRGYDKMPTGATWRDGQANPLGWLNVSGNVTATNGVWEDSGKANRWGQFDESWWRAKCQSFLDNGSPVTIDIEDDDPSIDNVAVWNIDNTRDDESLVDQYRDHWLTILRICREEMRERSNYRPVGSYLTPVIRDYFTIRNYLDLDPADDTYKATWEAHKAATYANKRVAAELDFLAPSIYAFYESASGGQAGWGVYAREEIRWAREFGLPVIPWIARKIHASGTPANAYPTWTKDMITIPLEEGCAGVFVFDTTTVADGGATPNTITEDMTLVNLIKRYTGNE